MQSWIIETQGLTKAYDNGKGCFDISIQVGRGEVFGFLGPNGAGKSTLIKTLLGLLHPTSGSASLLGKPLGDVSAKKQVGYLPELFKYQAWMTGLDLLKFHGELYKIEKHQLKDKIVEVLDLVHMTGAEMRTIGSYSKGMQQRIGMASALLSDPAIIFLDEPTSALDPIGRKEVRDIILTLRDKGKTVFLNSHLLGEVEQVCDSAAIISHGRIIKQGTMAELLKEDYGLELKVDNIDHKILSALEHFDEYFAYDGKMIKMHLNEADDAAKVAELIVTGGGKLYAMTPSANRLENLFLQLVEKGEE